MILYQPQNSVNSYNIDIVIYDDFYYIPNLHRDFELVYVMEGELDVHIDGKKQRLSKGDFCLILQNQVHGFETPHSSKVWVCVFADDYVRDFAAAVKGLSCEDNRIAITDSDRRFLEEKLVRSSPDRLEYIALFCYVCALFYKDRPFSRTVARDDQVFHKILKYISDRYTENITQAGMAKDLGYEPHYLSRYFNGFFGMSFKQFIHEYRINYAKKMMAAGEKSLSRIALDCGFGSIRNFNRVYRALEKEEPRQTQKRLTGEK